MAVTTKVSIALGKDALKWARDHASETGESLSSVLTTAVVRLREREEAEANRARTLDELIHTLTDGKGVSPRALAQALKELDAD